MAATGHDDRVNPAAIHYLILYRTPRCWRITMGGPEGMACGALEDTPADAPFSVAEHDFRQMLHRNWGFDRPVTWNETKPDWWSADVAPSSGE
jgi:hypothetical protein